MTGAGFALFETAIGHCAIAWGAEGLVGVQLPEADPGQTRQRMQRRFPALAESPPPAAVQDAIRAVTALLRGEPEPPADLSHLVLDMRGVPPFHQRVYGLARTIAPGETRTYGDMARQLGDPALARAVGQALGHNPFAPVVPCHRVLAAGGRAGGFSANGGLATKLRLLQIEHALFNGPGLFDEQG